jgi:CMP-N,N'-diacetyllegionaminic acid synthase
MNSTKSVKHLAFIPARGGSKGIKDKNLKTVGRKSLVKRSWDSCIEAGFFSEILLSTDSKVIANDIDPEIDFDSIKIDSIMFKSPNHAFHHRSILDAQDSSSIKTLLIKMAKLNELEFDYLWLIQPTSPFRYQNEFLELKRLLENQTDFTSLVSVKDVTSSHPDRMFTLQDDYLKTYLPSKKDESIPRQLLEKVYLKDGGFYIIPRFQLEKGHFLGDKILPFVRQSDLNVNIDSNSDLMFARFLVSKGIVDG